MGRPRKPLAKAIVSGATLRNPKRYVGRKGPARTRPVGEPYVFMSAPQKARWRELARDLPWLHSAHRTLLHTTCVLAARLDTEAGLGIAGMHALISALQKLGATPASESLVKHPDDDEEDPAEHFFTATRKHGLN